MKTLRDLMDVWEDGTLSPEDLQQLKSLLGHREARSEMREEACFFALLNETLGVVQLEAESELETDEQGVSKPLGARLSAWFDKWVPAGFRFRPALAWASIILLLLAGVATWYARPNSIGYLSQCGDGVLVTHSGRTSSGRPGSRIRAGDFITAPQFAAAAFHWKSEATQFYLSPGTRIQLNQTAAAKQVNLSNGVLKAVVARQPPSRPIIINSPRATAKVVGTRFTLSSSAKADRLEVVEGTVEFADIQHQQPSLTLHAGDYAMAAPGLPIEVKPVEGAAWWEVWVAGMGSLARDVPLPSSTVYQDYLGASYTLVWDYPFISDWYKRYRERVRGFITPEETGDYTFWMMSQKASELWLSRDAAPENKARIASTPAPPPGAPLTPAWNWVLQPGTDQTAMRNIPWNKFPSQKSAPQRLIAGQRYYFEAVHELVAGDCLAVVWSRPDDDFPAGTLPERVLSPLRK